ncbi:MAG: PIG-L family deacetylase [Phycisphaerales bacterium]|nr:PIG-L family deacetylase [Phycisphaerales bacterium]
MPNILVVGPHPDDQELGMGGTIALLADQGHNVLLLDITDGEPTPRGSRDVRLKEAAEAARALSPPAPSNPVRRHLLDLPNRLVEHTLENRHKVAGVIRAHQASIVFVPYFEDAHPDHLAVTRITEDARFDAKLTKLAMPGDNGAPPLYPTWLFYYYATHLRIVPQPSFIIDTSAFAQKKQAAVAAYRSQFADHPPNQAVPAMIAAQDAYFGSRIKAAAGECFFTREPIGLTGLGSLFVPSATPRTTH